MDASRHTPEQSPAMARPVPSFLQASPVRSSAFRRLSPYPGRLKAELQTCATALSCLLTLIVLLWPTLPVAAQSAPQPATAPNWSALEKALGKEDYAEAKKQADAIVQRGAPDDRAKAAAVYARILLGLGQTDQARQYLAMQAKQGFAPQHAAIYAAWLLAADGKPDEAAAALEGILQQAGESPDEAVAEAADVLAMLQMARGEKEKAKKTVEFGLKVLQYHGTKDGYVLTLLRARLAVDPDEAYPEAKKLYEQAEKLRCEGKAAEAGRLFTSVCAKYPLSTWNDAAGYRIGQCLETLGRSAQAERHWTAFVTGVPAGRWRGQARVGLVHLALVARGDLKTASQQAAAAHKILTAGVDEPAAATWNHAAVEIHLFQGIVALLEARHDAAAAALGEAKDQAVLQMEDPAGRFLAGLHRLIETAERREELIPAQLAVPDERLRLALSLGTIDNLLGRFEQAAGAFDHALRGPVRIALQPHRSFAALGKARALVRLSVARTNVAGTRRVPSANVAGTRRVPSDDQADDSLPAAKTAYLLSLGTLPDSAWHEHAQRELALLIEVLAARQAEALSATRTEAKAETGAKPLDPSSADVRAAVEAARAEALPYWEKLVGRTPASDYLPEALYHAGVLYSEGAKPAAEKSVAAFERLTNEFPASPWTGDAHVRLIDVKLEQQFDLPSAVAHARAAADWLDNVANVEGTRRVPFASGPVPSDLGPPPASDATESVPAPLNDGTRRVPSTLLPDDLFPASLPSLDQTSYAIYLRAGLVAYLSERPTEAVEWFERAKPFEPERNFVVVHGEIPTGIERLVAAARSGKSLTPEEARRGDEKARLILMLADVYHEAEQWRQSLDLCNRVIDNAAPKATREQRSYAFFRRGRNFYCLEDEGYDPEAAFNEYAAAARTAPKAPWADRAMFLAANVQWNDHQDADRAVELWRRLVDSYPDSEDADRSAYYIGVAYMWAERPEEAERALLEFVEKRPASRFATQARQHLAELERQKQNSERPAARKTPGRR